MFDMFREMQRPYLGVLRSWVSIGEGGLSEPLVCGFSGVNAIWGASHITTLTVSSFKNILLMIFLTSSEIGLAIKFH